MVPITSAKFGGNQRSFDPANSLTDMGNVLENGVRGIKTDCHDACLSSTCRVHFDASRIKALPKSNDMTPDMPAFAPKLGANRLSGTYQLKVPNVTDGLTDQMPEKPDFIRMSGRDALVEKRAKRPHWEGKSI